MALVTANASFSFHFSSSACITALYRKECLIGCRSPPEETMKMIALTLYGTAALLALVIAGDAIPGKGVAAFFACLIMFSVPVTIFLGLLAGVVSMFRAPARD
jgi:hypothetical protein